MQRSIGKKILAVVAGVGLVASGAVAFSSGAGAAESEFCGSGYAQGLNTSGNNIRERAEEDARKNCELAGYGGVTFQNGPEGFLPDSAIYFVNVNGYGDKPDTGGGTDPDDLEDIAEELVEPTPPPPPCWSAEAGGNCPVGGALQAAVREYMIAGVPQQALLYSSWRPDANSAAQPTGGTAVLRMDGEDIASAPFVDGVATFSFTPTAPGLKEVTFSGVVSSGLSGQSAYLDSADAATMVLPYDPEALEEALKNKKVEVGDTYTLEEIAQAKTALGKRLEWRVAQDSKDVCAVTTTKKGEVRAKFTESGKCSIIWTDPKKDEEGKYTFKVTA